METMVREERRTARLNPFFFPSDTDFRFVLLAVAVLGATLFTYNLIWNNLARNSAWYTEQSGLCLARPEASLATVVRRASAGEEVEPAGLCMAPVNRSIVRLGVQGAVIVFSLAGLGYWLLPAWRLRRGRLEPITAADVPEVAGYLAELAREAGLRRPPTFVWNPLAVGGTPLAFGNLRSRYVFLPTGLIQEFYVDRPLFRAVVLHELAHLRNADVDKTFLSIFLWRAYLVAAILPAVVVSLDGLTFSDVGALGWRLLALAALVLLVRNGVLRSREVYADVRVSAWESDPGPLERALAAQPAPAPTARWRRLFETHPPAEVRRAALRDTRPLFEMGAGDAAATGAVVALSIPHVFRAINMVDLSGLSATSVLLTALILSPLVVGVLGTGVWRAALAARVLGQPAPRFDRLAYGFGAGMGVGSAVSLSTFGAMSYRPGLVLLGLLVWSLLLALSLRPLLRWTGDGARAWLEILARTPSPRATALLGLSAATLLVTLWLGLVIFAHPIDGLQLTILFPGVLGTLGAPFAAASALLFTLPAPLILLAAVSLWLYPILPLAWRPRAPLAPRWDWAFLGGDAPVAADPAPAAPFRAAARFALASAVLYAALTVAIRLWFRLVSDLPQDRRSLTAAAVLAGLAMLLQAVVARRAARRAAVLPAPTGLFAAFLAGMLMLGAFHAVNLAFQGTLSIGFIWLSLRVFIGGGFLLSLLALLRLPRAPAPAH